MAQLNKAAYEAKYNDAGTGIFKTGQTRGIGSEDTRALVEDNADSVPFTADDTYTWSSPQVTATGTNTYAATPSPVITAYATGQAFKIKFTNASSGVSTLNLNAVGAKKIFINPTTQATTGHIVAGQINLLVYDAALDTAAGGFLMIGATSSVSGSLVESVSGQNNAVDNTDPANPIVRNGVREVTGADASVLADNNGLVKFNSATPFNFTLDQLAAGTKISFVNYGAGAVTFINGSGVTLAGNAVLSGAVGTAYPSCVVIYDTLTTPRILNSSANSLTLVSVDTTGATITLDFLLEKERMFEGSASFATAKAVTLANDTNALVLMVTFNLTNVAAVLTFDSEFVMSSTDSRWDNTGKTFTVPSGMTGVYKFTAAKNIAGTVWRMEATNQFPS